VLIDWFTVGAQALNFIILVWLLQRFLYKPVLAAVDARETAIAARLADADAKKAQARQERDTFAQKNAAFDADHDALMQKATKDAATQAGHLLDAAGHAADELAAKRHQALQSDAVALNKALRRLTQQEVFAIARKTLADLADAGLEDAMVTLFIRRLQALDAPAKAEFAKALKGGGDPVLIRSAFDLPAAQQASVKAALHDAFASDGPVRFETAPDLVSGIDLAAGGRKIAWTIADYLAAMDQSVTLLVQGNDTKAQARHRTAPKPKARPAHKHAAHAHAAAKA
jgi:F-type H+-transporting ATPase subunit b